MQDDVPREDRDPSGADPSSAGCAGTFSRKGRRGGVAAPDKRLLAFAKTMRRAQTPAEEKLWRLLRDRRFSNYKFRRQVPIGPYIADFVCFETRLIVEADGSQHGESQRDAVRDAWLRAEGFRIRRFWNADILARPIETMDTYGRI